MNQIMKETINQINVNWQWTKIKAMENINTSDYIFLARDNVKKIKNEKHYASIMVSDMKTVIPKILQDNNHLCEILPENQLIKLYFDLELEQDGLQSKDAYILLIKFLHWVNKQILIKFDITMEIDDYIILDSNRENKLSYHVISNTKICFENINTLKEFIVYLYAEMETDENNNDFIWYHKDEKRFIFDKIPYNKDQCYRMINQSKHGKNHILKYIGNNDQFNVLDTLVRIYNKNIDELFIIMSNTESIKDARKEKKETKETNDNKIIKTKTFVTTGINLMEKNNISIETMKKFPLYLQYLYLIPNQSQPYDIYRNAGFAIKSCGGYQRDFRDWASLSSSKYLSKTGGKFIRNFDKFLLGKQCLKLPYLKQLAKESHPEYFDEGIIRLDQYFNPNCDGIRIIEEDTQYLSSLNKIFLIEKIILLRAQLGGGKTTAIKKFIEQNNCKRILFVSPRITFSQFISTEFDTKFYLDEDVKLNSDRLTISIESLHKIKFNTNYDVVVMDECEANLNVFSSSTIRQNQLECYEVLNNFIKNSKRTILASAFITQKTIDFINSLKCNSVCIYNTIKPNLKKAYRFHQDILTIKLIESIKHNEKIIACFAQKIQ